MWIVALLITLLVTAISLVIISKIPFTGVEINSFGTAFVSAIVFGILNALVGPVLRFLGAPLTWLTLGLFAIIINAIIFSLAAWLVTGFRLRNGFISALLGAILLGLINSLLFQILGQVFPAVVPAT
ncbi:MAG TPA: phage holin family protein [Chroococcidiopsis sp.]